MSLAIHNAFFDGHARAVETEDWSDRDFALADARNASMAMRALAGTRSGAERSMEATLAGIAMASGPSAKVAGLSTSQIWAQEEDHQYDPDQTFDPAWDTDPPVPLSDRLNFLAQCQHERDTQGVVDLACRMRRGQYGVSHHTISWAEGGEFIRIKDPYQPQGRDDRHRGDRKPCTEFSDRSRRSLQAFLSKVDRGAAPQSRVWFLTLTYPASWPADPHEWKRHLHNIRRRLDRAFGPMGLVWKLEPQRRGAPHFHILLLVPPDWATGLNVIGQHQGRAVWRGGKLGEFRQWISRAWFEVVASRDDKHLRAGTQVAVSESWGQVSAYCAKGGYLGKPCQWTDEETGELMAVGRFWGVYQRQLWPIVIRHTGLDEGDAVKCRRLIRKVAERQYQQRHNGRRRRYRCFRTRKLAVSWCLPGSWLSRVGKWPNDDGLFFWAGGGHFRSFGDLLQQGQEHARKSPGLPLRAEPADWEPSDDDHEFARQAFAGRGEPGF